MEVTEIADELYAQPPNAFTAARDEAVAGARNAGNRPLATQIAALKRPTVGAWLVNVVALRRPDVLNELFEVADAIRLADGAAQLRELSQRRRRSIDSVLAAATAEAERAGAPEPTRQQLAEAESTLTAAMADPETAEVVRAGRVLRALSYGGFGGLGGLDLGATAQTTSAATSTRTQTTKGTKAEKTTGTTGMVGMATKAGTAAGRAAENRIAADDQAQVRIAEAEARLAEAHARVDAAARAVADAADAETAAARRKEELSEQIDTLRARLDEADRQARVARQARLTAERDLVSAKRRLDRATTP